MAFIVREVLSVSAVKWLALAALEVVVHVLLEEVAISISRTFEVVEGFHAGLSCIELCIIDVSCDRELLVGVHGLVVSGLSVGLAAVEALALSS